MKVARISHGISELLASASQSDDGGTIDGIDRKVGDGGRLLGRGGGAGGRKHPLDCSSISMENVLVQATSEPHAASRSLASMLQTCP